MTRDADKDAKAAEIVARHDGGIERVEDSSITAVIPAKKYGGFTADLASAGFVSHPEPRPSSDNSVDTNWHKIIL